jgi:hypothetical protein
MLFSTSRSLAAHRAARQPVQFRIDKGHERIECRPVPVAPCHQESGYVLWTLACHDRPPAERLCHYTEPQATARRTLPRCDAV